MSNFEGWLQSLEVLFAADREAPHATWLQEAGAKVSYAKDAEDARSSTAQDSPYAVAVLDADRLGRDWRQIAHDLPPTCRCVVLSAEADAKLLRKVLNLRAEFASKDSSKADFMFAMATAASLGVPNMRSLAARAKALWKLPPQLARVLYYNLWSYSDKNIATAMGLSEHTVQEYQDELRKRTGVRSKHGYMRRLLACAGEQPPMSMSDETLARLQHDQRSIPQVAMRGDETVVPDKANQ